MSAVHAPGSRIGPYEISVSIGADAPSPDGQRFLVAVQADTGAPTIHLITNWLKAARGTAKE